MDCLSDIKSMILYLLDRGIDKGYVIDNKKLHEYFHVLG